MVDSPEDVAERALPGWKAVGLSDGVTHRGVDARTPGMASVRKKYGVARAGAGGLAPASSSADGTEVVIMAPPADMEAVGRKLVVVRNGRAVIVQG